MIFVVKTNMIIHHWGARLLSDSIERITVNEIIENLREKMHLLAISYGLSHPQVLEISQLLDHAIINFYRQRPKF